MDKELFNQLIKVIDEGNDLIQEYDAHYHEFENIMLYPVETQTIRIIGDNSKITTSDIAKKLNKSVSASSQILTKLEKKNVLIKETDSSNHRKIVLKLTDIGKRIYQRHDEMEREILERYYNQLKKIDSQKIKTYIEIQEELNKQYRQDINESF